MIINKFNYEAYVLDYLEGNLSEEMLREMESFFKTYPEVEADILSIKNFKPLRPDLEIIYPSKTALLKTSEKVIFPKIGYRILAIAASFLLLAMAYFAGYQNGIKNTNQTIAQTKIKEQKTTKAILPIPSPPPKIVQSNPKANPPKMAIKKTLDLPVKTQEEKVGNRSNKVAFFQEGRNHPTN